MGLILFAGLRWVVTARIKRMATKNPAKRFPSTSPKSVSFHCLDGIMAARWRKTTRRPQPGTDPQLVQAD